MHEEDQGPLKGAINMETPPKKPFFPSLLAIFSVWPEMGHPKSGQTKFGLKWGTPNQDKLSLALNPATRWRCSTCFVY